MSESSIKIENVVASTKLAEEFDLTVIESEFEGAEYNKQKFPGLVYRVSDPKAAFLVFTSGKVVCTGAKNVADLHTILNLNAIAIGLGLENIEYEPEQFPGLVYRIDEPKVVVLIFSSGKLVVTGGKSPQDCEKGVKVVRQQLDNMGLL